MEVNTKKDIVLMPEVFKGGGKLIDSSCLRCVELDHEYVIYKSLGNIRDKKELADRLKSIYTCEDGHVVMGVDWEKFAECKNPKDYSHPIAFEVMKWLKTKIPGVKKKIQTKSDFENSKAGFGNLRNIDLIKNGGKCID